MKLSSEIREGLFIAADAIRANKLRSILTTLGLVIGIVTVTLMGTAIEGLNAAFLRSISVLGADVLHVDRFSWFNNSQQDWIKAQNRTEITVAQVREVVGQGVEPIPGATVPGACSPPGFPTTCAGRAPGS